MTERVDDGRDSTTVNLRQSVNSSRFGNGNNNVNSSRSKMYERIRESGLNYEQTKQFLLGRQMRMHNAKKNAKYALNRGTHANAKKLQKMITKNGKYLTVPHGLPEHLKKSNNG